MPAFFEFRQYRVKDGKRERWVKFMEERVIPFQVERGVQTANRRDVGSREDCGYALGSHGEIGDPVRLAQAFRESLRDNCYCR
ncbi:MAG: hypothetical protein ACKVQA_04040 [Burkholderiales bacterium]